MKAAIIAEAGQPPVYGEFPRPLPQAGKTLIRVSASALSHVTRSRASGSHYSGKATLPFVPGVDGVGVGPGGQRVYFLFPEPPYGAMAEACLVDERHCFHLPAGLGSEDAAAMAIPGMSSWAALVERARLRAGETVLINGATGASGRLAVQIAKHLGASKVIATRRRPAALDELVALGADVIVPLNDDREQLEQDVRATFEQGVDIVLDYLWGTSAEALIRAAAKFGPDEVPVRYVSIGSLGGQNIELPSAALRSSALQLMGSGMGSIPFDRLIEAIHGVLAAAPTAGFRIATQSVPLSDVARVWGQPDTGRRLVLVP
jgi:NADPH:quinone reductase-like Zn-dependent oxidoreductase